MLSRCARATGGIYYQATRRTESEHLASLERQVGNYFVAAALRQGAGFGSWEGLFGYLAERTGEKRSRAISPAFRLNTCLSSAGHNQTDRAQAEDTSRRDVRTYSLWHARGELLNLRAVACAAEEPTWTPTPGSMTRWRQRAAALEGFMQTFALPAA